MKEVIIIEENNLIKKVKLKDTAAFTLTDRNRQVDTITEIYKRRQQRQSRIEEQKQLEELYNTPDYNKDLILYVVWAVVVCCLLLYLSS